MDEERPQYYANDLTLAEINESGLRNLLQELGTAIRKSVDDIETGCPAPKAGDDFGTIFSGQLGIAYSLLRVHSQLKDQPSLESGSHESFEAKSFISNARARIDLQARSSSVDINPGRPSPITSAVLGALVLRVLSGQWLEQDPKNLLAVMELSIAQAPTFLFREHAMGVDEVLYGRTGLLWAVLEIWKRCPDQPTQTAFAPVFQNIHKLVAAILEAGRAGAKAHREQAEEKDSANMPLMWSWFDNYFSLGAMHGIAGALSILLDPTLPRHSLSILESYSDIAQTISALCELCLDSEGQLPMSVPARPSSRSEPLVQICHGTPGILTLLAAAKRNVKFSSHFWHPQWDRAIAAASDVIWSQGLLSKGCSLCHGIGGNALSLLVLVDPLDDKSDGHLAAGLTMLLKARSTPPYAEGNPEFRTPDHPWSLFEGLAGLLCAWSETYCLVKVRLKVLELKASGQTDVNSVVKDEEVIRLQRRLLGFPCLVGGTTADLQFSFMA